MCPSHMALDERPGLSSLIPQTSPGQCFHGQIGARDGRKQGANHLEMGWQAPLPSPLNPLLPHTPGLPQELALLLVR